MTAIGTLSAATNVRQYRVSDRVAICCATPTLTPVAFEPLGAGFAAWAGTAVAIATLTARTTTPVRLNSFRMIKTTSRGRAISRRQVVGTP
jgi:hypothetical protein